jgi:HAD superfamily hydrolase (TIGR01509 family)
MILMTMPYQAIIYDLDGTLIDSERHWEQANRIFFGKRSAEVTPEMIRYMTGRSTWEALAYFKASYGWSEEVADLRDELLAMTEDIYLRKAAAMPGASEIIAWTRGRFPKQAIASGSGTRRIETVVDRLRWRNSFDALVSSEHVGHRGKPDPAIFLFAADKLGAAPENCIVIEDSENGVAAAVAAGMRCVAVLYENSAGNYSRADLVVRSLVDPRLTRFLGASKDG